MKLRQQNWLIALIIPALAGCFPLGDDGTPLDRNNSASAGTAMGKSTEIGDLIRADIEDAISDNEQTANSLYFPNTIQSKTVSIPSNTSAVSVQVDVCGTGEAPLQLDIWFDYPETGSNTAQLEATEDCTYQNKANTVITAGSTVAYVGTPSTTEASSFEAEYNFELESTNGTQTAGARDLVVTGSHNSEFTFSPLAYSGTSTNSANGEVYAPNLGEWLELTTSTNVVANYSVNFTTPADSFFNRSAGTHKLEDGNDNFVSVTYSIDDESETQFIDYDLNGDFQWQVSYSY